MNEEYLIGYNEMDQETMSWINPNVIKQEPYMSNLERVFAFFLSLFTVFILYILLKNSVYITPKDYAYLVCVVLILLMTIVGFIYQILG
jgi:hypothetical protein